MALLLLVSLAFSLWGVLPYGGVLDSSRPYQVKEIRERGFILKDRCLRATAGFLFVAFAAALVGVILRLIYPWQP